MQNNFYWKEIIENVILRNFRNFVATLLQVTTSNSSTELI